MTASFDAVAKEKELQAEAASWDTSIPVPAREGDIPVVDVGPWFKSNDPADLHLAAAALRESIEQVGTHFLVGHGIEAEETAEILQATRDFHALDAKLKETIRMDRPAHPIGGSGWLPFGSRKLPRRAKGNLCEAFIVKRSRDIGFNDNQWLAEDALPGFRDKVERYNRRIEALAQRLLPLWAVALDLPIDFFAGAFRAPFQRLRMTHYPVNASSMSDEYGLAPHVDTSFLTLLLQDSPGLVIFSQKRQRWVSVPHIPGAFTVFSGELLRTWSNDRVLSARHFANNPETESRYIVAFFFNATGDYSMECLPSCHGPGNPPKYPPVSYDKSQASAQGE